MASENPDDKDGTKNSGEKKYIGVQKSSLGRFSARCGSGAKRHIGSFVKAADAARAYDKRAWELYGALAKLNFPDFHTDEFPDVSSEQEELNDFAEYLNNYLSDEESSNSALPTVTSSEVRTTGGLIGSSGSTTIAVAEPNAAAEQVTLPIAEPSVTGVANRPDESANILSEQEKLNKYAEYVNNLLDEEDGPSEQEVLIKDYVEDLKKLISDEKGSKSS